MQGGGVGTIGPSHHARSKLVERLQLRRSDIEQATLTRIKAISDPTEVATPGYLEGLRTAVGIALDFGLAAIREDERSVPVLPGTLLSQARLAARSGVSLDTVLRRYFAGHSLLSDFILAEARDDDFIDGAELKRLLWSQQALFDHLLAVVSEEYNKEAEERLTTSEQRRLRCVRRLLAGELIEAAELDYDFEAYHVGVVAVGSDVSKALQLLASALDRRLLLVRPDDRSGWAWLGAQRKPSKNDLDSLVSLDWPQPTTISLGEPGWGLTGWRLTHRQAAAALPVAVRSGGLARYADVALLSSVLHDDLLATSLRQLYLLPLETDRDGGLTAIDTLRAYFSAGRNVSCAAATLGVTRRTVTNRLHGIEERIGRPLDAITAQVEAAIHLHDFGTT